MLRERVCKGAVLGGSTEKKEKGKKEKERCHPGHASMDFLRTPRLPASGGCRGPVAE